MNITASSSSNQLPDIYATQYGIKPLSEQQKSKSNIIDKNVGITSFPEPKKDLLSKLLGNDNYHFLYNHNKSEICQAMQNYPNDVTKIKNIIIALPSIKVNIRCRWIAIITVIIILILMFLYINNNTDKLFKFLLGLSSILIIGGIAYKFIGGSIAINKGNVEWNEFINEFNNLSVGRQPFEVCNIMNNRDMSNKQLDIMKNQSYQNNRGLSTGLGQGLGFGVGYNVVKSMF
jgi:hypothetical protein